MLLVVGTAVEMDCAIDWVETALGAEVWVATDLRLRTGTERDGRTGLRRSPTLPHVEHCRHCYGFCSVCSGTHVSGICYLQCTLRRTTATTNTEPLKTAISNNNEPKISGPTTRRNPGHAGLSMNCTRTRCSPAVRRQLVPAGREEGCYRVARLRVWFVVQRFVVRKSNSDDSVG